MLSRKGWFFYSIKRKRRIFQAQDRAIDHLGVSVQRPERSLRRTLRQTTPHRPQVRQEMVTPRGREGGRHRDDGRIAAVTVDERMVASAAPRLLVLAFDDFPGLAHELKDV